MAVETVFEEHKRLVAPFEVVYCPACGVTESAYICPCKRRLVLGKTCSTCDNLVCEECCEKGFWEIGEYKWLWVTAECFKCKRFLCEECVWICYTCALNNQREHAAYTVFCKDCKPEGMKQNATGDWIKCDKHWKQPVRRIPTSRFSSEHNGVS